MTVWPELCKRIITMCQTSPPVILTVATSDATTYGVRRGVASGLKLLERSIAAFRKDEDIPVLEAHGCGVDGCIRAQCRQSVGLKQ